MGLFLNRVERGRMNAYLRMAADKFNLKDWTVRFDPLDPDDDDADAEIHTLENQHAHVRFCRHFMSYSLMYQRLVIAHELSHLPMTRAEDIVRALRELLPPKTYEYVFATYADAEEQSVEWTARLLAPQLPLPRIRTKSSRKKKET